MINVEHYLQDGANWQAQAVLAYLRDQAFTIRENARDLNTEPIIEVGRFENCREQGYVFRLRLGIEILKNYAVYEHRNSDNLIVLESTNNTINTPSIEEMFNGRDKWGYDKSFIYGQIIECGKYILEDMQNTLSEFVAKHQAYLKENN